MRNLGDWWRARQLICRSLLDPESRADDQGWAFQATSAWGGVPRFASLTGRYQTPGTDIYIFHFVKPIQLTGPADI